MNFLRQYIKEGDYFFFYCTYSDYEANLKERRIRMPFFKWDKAKGAWKCSSYYINSPALKSYINDFGFQLVLVPPTKAAIDEANRAIKKNLESQPKDQAVQPIPQQPVQAPPTRPVNPNRSIAERIKSKREQAEKFFAPSLLPSKTTSELIKVGDFEQGVKDSYAVSSDFTPQIQFKDKSFQLYPYQRAGVEFAVKRGLKSRVIIADDMGIGKTCQGFAAVAHLDAFPLLIVCPNNVMRNWYNELTTKLTRLRVLESKAPIRHSDFKFYDIFIFNYNFFSNEKKAKEFMKVAGEFMAVILDEAHSIKNTDSKVYRNLLPVAKSIPVCYPMTGTAYANKAIDLYAPILLVNGESLFGGAKTLREFLLNNPDKKILKDLGKDLRGNYMLYGRSKNQPGMNMQLPDKTVSVVNISIDNFDEYKKADDEFMDYLLEVKKMPTEKAQRLMYNEVLTKLSHLIGISSRGKINSAVEFVLNITKEGHKVIVFCKRHETLQALHKEFGPISVEYHGKLNTQKKEAAISKFKYDPGTQVFTAILDSAYQGINLQEACYVVFVDMDWTYSRNVQAEDRSYRTGQKNNVSVYYLVDDRTIDQTIWHVVQDKRSKHEAFTGENDVPMDTATEKNQAMEIMNRFMSSRK